MLNSKFQSLMNEDYRENFKKWLKAKDRKFTVSSRL